ncbi:TPA: hypothetical protein KM775_000184 [Clostridioides difficile]|uniref:hypothetical protein n=1 Tax=Clostridioides difficile TaxID=1496 RepID=UPI00093DFCCD|nr:hypothetical protein [Clostridioides difficile]MBY1153616.1 hypothetical protein [Clostridioides difficile]MCD8683876.1 hypothetical protein [Clostridioides difficile]HBE8798100.1 hypothetical protein [Clostridioides difficile]HBF0381048.1 hypothetical protein [Clostridioides difficile]
MYIDTHTKETMEKSICSYLGVTLQDLSVLFNLAGNEAQQDKFLDGDKLNDIFNSFIKAHMPNKELDEVLFFHLSRRLNTASDCNVGNNLFELLSTENAMTLFLKEHDVEFVVCDKHLNLIYKGKEISLDDTNKEHIPYLRWRLGYNANRIDFCINGFLLKDLLYRNSYARELYDVPEFIGVLATFLKRRDIGTDYFDNSKYYCFEYCLPLVKVMFDEKDSLAEEQKVKYLLNQILNRLYEYHTHDIRYMFDHENPIIRLTDNDTMDEQYYISKEEITWDMLG